MNIAEILKYCPKGTKLYSTIFGEVIFERVSSDETYPIKVKNWNNETCVFTEEGKYLSPYKGECILFPSKDQRDWNEFKIPVKKGDIMMQVDGTLPFIASGESTIDNYPKYICGITDGGNFKINEDNYSWTNEFYIPATEEVKEKLFEAIKEAGYKWNSETLELERVFKSFDSVLVRNSEDSDWELNLFSYYRKEAECDYYVCLNGFRFKYCIHYEGNEHLLGTCKDK